MRQLLNGEPVGPPVACHESNALSRKPWKAFLTAWRSLRASFPSRPFRISAVTSVSRNSIVMQRMPSRRRSRCRRIRSAAGEGGGAAVSRALVTLSPPLADDARRKTIVLPGPPAHARRNRNARADHKRRNAAPPFQVFRSFRLFGCWGVFHGTPLRNVPVEHRWFSTVPRRA